MTAAARKDARENNASTKAEKYHSKAAKRILSKLAAEKKAILGGGGGVAGSVGSGSTTEESSVADMSAQQIIKRSKVRVVVLISRIFVRFVIFNQPFYKHPQRADIREPL